MSKLLKLFFLLSISILYAEGTLAGTAIVNQARAIYTLGGIDYNLTTNTDSFVVDQIIDLHISWQDTNSVEVGVSEPNRVLTFVLTNLGNGEDNATLTYEHNVSSDFLPQNVQLFQDSNGNGVFESGIDMPINNITLGADSNSTLFIVSDIPDGNYTVDERSYDAIAAVSQSNTTVGVDNQHAVDVVVRSDNDRAEGSYVIRDYWLASRKRVLIYSEDNQTHTGTIVTYKIELSIGGNHAGRNITGIVLRDNIPAGTLYQASTLRLDGVSLTDSVDVDNGSVVSNEVRVEIGTLSGAVHQVVTFDVQVQ